LALPVRIRTSPPGHHRVFSSHRHPPRVQRSGIAFLRLAPLLEAHMNRRAACAVAIGARTSPGVRHSPSALEMEGARIFPEIPTSGTFRPWGFSPLRRVASPFIWPGLFHPVLRSWGSPVRRRLAPAFRPSRDIGVTTLSRPSPSAALSSAGAPHGVLLQGFHPSLDSPDFSPGLPRLHFRSPGSVARSTRAGCF
jgi:hypothetical protein